MHALKPEPYVKTRAARAEFDVEEQAEWTAKARAQATNDAINQEEQEK